jgi:ATP-binding cassette, subfamily B, bacterial PglK
MIKFKKIEKLFDSKIKKKFYIIVIFNFFISLLEFLSVASIYPALLIITNVSSNKLIDKLFLLLNMDVQNNSLNFFLILILILVVLKNIFSILLSWYMQNFLLKNYNFISEITIKKMLQLNYLDLINLTSSNFIRNGKEIIFSFKTYVMSLVMLSSELIMVFMLIVLLLLISFKITIITLIVLSLFLFLLTRLSKNKISILGKIRNKSYSEVNSSLIEVYNSFRELKIYSNVDFYINNYLKYNMNFATAQKNIDFFGGITRNIFELIIIFFFSLAFIITGFELNLNFLPTVGIFVFTFFRLYPSFTRISFLKTIINSNTNSIDILLDIQNFKVEKLIDNKQTSKKFSFNQKIHIENASFGYERNQLIIKNLDLHINKGDIIGISGNNGSGKTTLCNIILSVIVPLSGKVMIDEKYNTKDFLEEYRKIVSFIPQNIFLLNDTIINNITFNLKNEEFNEEKLNNIIKITGLESVNANLKKRSNSFIGENGFNLSGGQRQRVAIARALYKDSQIVIMDEHTSALDNVTEKVLLEDMKNLFKNKTIIIISHRKQVLNYCSKHYHLENGKLNLLT